MGTVSGSSYWMRQEHTNLGFFQRDVYLFSTFLCFPLLQDVLYGFSDVGLTILFVVPDFRYHVAAASVVLVDLQQSCSHSLVHLFTELLLQAHQFLILIINDLLKHITLGRAAR